MSNLLSRGYSRVGTPIRQAAGFAGSSVIASIIGGGLAILLARSLTTDQFGTYAFAGQLLLFVAMFCDFGLFLPAARRAALADEAAKSEILGAALIAYLPVGLVCSAAVLGLSYLVQPLFHVPAGPALRTVAPLAFVYPFPFVAQQLIQGLGRLHVYSIGSVLPQALFLAIIVALVSDHHHLDVPLLLFLNAITLFAGWLVTVAWLRPKARSARQWVTAFARDAREYGAQVYLGRVVGIGTYNMDVLMVAAFTNVRLTGFYVLAGSIAATVGLPAGAVSSALFARMASQDRLDPRALQATVACGIVATAGAAALVIPFVYLVIGSRYRPVIGLVLILAPAGAVRGVTTLYNGFLSAQGRGRELRNAALVLTIVNLAGNFALIPRFGAAGAAWASLLALLANLVAHIAGYQKLLQENRAVHLAAKVTVQ